jgi:hypothetical protein
MRTAWRARLGSRVAWGMAAATTAVLALAACTSSLTPATSSSGHGRGGSQPGKVITLNHITTLRTLFNHDSGHPRLILIFSPT